jgi:hypothetical protein
MMDWLRRVLGTQADIDEREHREDTRQAALTVAAQAEVALEHSKMMRELIIAETQYQNRVRGRGVRRR